MRTVAVTCPSCGAQLDVDLKTKSAICEFCNRRVVLTEDDIAAGELVENNVALAKEAFLDGDIKNAESPNTVKIFFMLTTSFPIDPVNYN